MLDEHGRRFGGLVLASGHGTAAHSRRSVSPAPADLRRAFWDTVRRSRDGTDRRFGRAGGRPRRPSCSRELPDLDRHLRDASRVAPVETEPAPSESYPAGLVTVERTRDTWLPRLLLTESFGGGGQATSKAPLSHAGGDDEASGSGSSTASFSPPVDASCAATSSRALRERCRCGAGRSDGSWTPRIPPPCSPAVMPGPRRSAPCELTDRGASLQGVMLSIRVSAESHTHEVLAQPRQVRHSRRLAIWSVGSVTLPAVMRGGRTRRPRRSARITAWSGRRGSRRSVPPRGPCPRPGL
jgi:hypothetical protein